MTAKENMALGDWFVRRVKLVKLVWFLPITSITLTRQNIVDTSHKKV